MSNIPVVNCFQKFVSLIFWATNRICFFEQIQLWIAFKSLYLWYSEQPKVRKQKAIWSCELLSKVCIFDILSNVNIRFYAYANVVNCFQKFVSLIFWATIVSNALRGGKLWIAFKSLYLWYSEQLHIFYYQKSMCCELLSKVCIFDILSNTIETKVQRIVVVNCFQKFVSLIFWATVPWNPPLFWSLWIAFKSLYLWYSEQQHLKLLYSYFRCELLSKVCIFDILSNFQNSHVF